LLSGRGSAGWPTRGSTARATSDSAEQRRRRADNLHFTCLSGPSRHAATLALGGSFSLIPRLSHHTHSSPDSLTILTHPQTLSPYSLIPRLSHRGAGQTLYTVKYLEDSKYFQDSPSSLYLLPSSHVSPQPRIPSPQDAASGTAHMHNMHYILRMRNLGTRDTRTQRMNTFAGRGPDAGAQQLGQRRREAAGGGSRAAAQGQTIRILSI